MASHAKGNAFKFSDTLSTRQLSVWLTNKSFWKQTTLPEQREVCICVCVWKNRQERSSLCGFTHTVSHVSVHTQTGAPGVPGATIAAQEERDHSREGKWKHVSKKKGFNFHESSVRGVICFSLSVLLFLLVWLSHHHHTCLWLCHWLWLGSLYASG